MAAISNATHAHHASGDEPGDINIVALWLRWDTRRVIAGAMAGIFAGLFMAAFAGVFTMAFGGDFLYPVKVAALPFLGGAATETGFHVFPIAVGLIAHLGLSMVLGMVYGHFTVTNALAPLLGAGFVWGTFSWIFITCLFVQSFADVKQAQLNLGAAFAVNLVFGLALASVAFFDRMIRGNR